MKQRPIVLNGITVRYGETTVRELIDAGYTISDFEQIIEEPAVAICNLNRENTTVAMISFYGIKKIIEQEQLYDRPIDFVLLKKSRRRKSKRKDNAMRNRIVYTIAIHAIAAALFALIYAVPALGHFVQNAKIRRNGGEMELGMALLILPTLLIAFIWAGGVVGEKGKVLQKIGVALWLIFNVALSITYGFLIGRALH